MDRVKKERRKYYRYDMEMKVFFRIAYDITTRIKFQVLDLKRRCYSSRKYSGLSKNISAEGLGFVSRRRLNVGDIILLEVYVPKAKIPVVMQGEVCWSKKLPHSTKYKDMFHTGVRLITVDGQSVAQSIYYDRKHKVIWGIALEAVFSSFKEMVAQLKLKKKAKR